MSTDLTVILENRPGTLAEMGEALGAAEVNIDGYCGFPVDGKGLIHILVENAAAARDALENKGIEVQNESNVLVIDVVDKPGVLGEIFRRIADAGVNVDFSYLATNSRLVIGADDLEKAGSAL